MSTLSERTEITPISRDISIRLSSCAGLLAAYLAAVKNDLLTPFDLAFFAVAVVWSLVLEHRFPKLLFSASVKIGFVTLGFAAFALFISGHGRGTTVDFANSIARFLFWNAIIFILSRNKSESDLCTLAIIELSLFTISAAFVKTPLFLPLLLVSAASLVFRFQRSALLKISIAGDFGNGGLGLSFVTLLLTTTIGVALFVTLPRRSINVNRSLDTAGVRRARPSEKNTVNPQAEKIGVPQNSAFLDLTNFGKLKSDPRSVLTIRISDLNDHPLPRDRTMYLRGAILDTYTNGHWSADFKRQIRRDGDDGYIDGWTPLENTIPANRTIARQHIRTTTLSEDLTFALADPIRVRWNEARYDQSGTLFFATLPNELIEYDVESALAPVEAPVTLDSIGSAPAIYLQLPPGLDRLREIAISQTKDAPQILEKVAKLEEYLRQNEFTYSLNAFVPDSKQDAVEHFLARKKGYCVHYATALALMCRAIGAPARLATGLQLRDPDEDGLFVVKLSDAHAWVEVWYGPENGWRNHDATPVSSSQIGPPASESKAAGTKQKNQKEGKKPQRRWDQTIIDFDSNTQRNALRVAGPGLLGLLASVGVTLISPASLWLIGGIASVAVFAYLLSPRRKRHRIRQIVSGFRDSSTVDFYREFLWALSKRGLKKHPALTAKEFATHARANVGDAGVDFVTEKFYETCYRRTAPSQQDRARIDQIIAALLEKS